MSGEVKAITTISRLAGKQAPRNLVVDLIRVERGYFERQAYLSDPNQLVSFGTRGHGSSPLKHIELGLDL